MNCKSLTFWICVFALIVSAGQVGAQCITFSPDYAVYASASTNGVNIYTSVTIDGSGSMYINTNLPGCSSLLNVHAIHTPFAVNVIAASDGSTYVGGGLNGAGECPDCYLSVTNNQSITPVDGMTYNFSAATEVYCNVGGAVFGFNWPTIQIELASTKSQWDGASDNLGDGSLECDVSQWCTTATQPPDCNLSYVIQEPILPFKTAACRPFYTSIWLAERFGTSGPWICLPLLPGQNAIGTSDESLGVCTKHP